MSVPRTAPELLLGARPLLAVLAALSLSAGCALNRYNKAQEYADQAHQMWRRGVTALELGKVGEAETWLRKAAEATPEDADSHGHLAEALWRGGSHDEAIGHAELACQCEPTDSAAAIRAGRMRLDQDSPQQAVDWANRAVGLDARSSEAWALRGRAHQRLGEVDLALADFQQALRYAPNDERLLTDLALLYRARGEHRRCLTTLHHLLDNHGPGEQPAGALALAGESYLAIGRARDAADTLRLAAERGQTGADILYRLAEAEAACGQADRAIADARRALQADSGHAPSQQLLARLLPTAETVQLR